ncbi:MAG: cytochrome c [Zetaproteobacteria bacterium]|nr:cytochrome c [Zetaproteobacteria bacterium]
MTTQKQTLKPGEKLLFMVAGAFVVFAIVAFIIMQIVSSKSEKPLFETRTHANLSVEGQKGSELFRVNGCTTCHRALRNGTNMGQTADLDGVGSRRTMEWMYAFFQDPESVYGAVTIDHGPSPKVAFYVAQMPKEDLHAIAVFLSELISEQGSSSAPMPPEGRSSFIDSMVKTWAPVDWKDKYQDIREKDVPVEGATTTEGVK